MSDARVCCLVGARGFLGNHVLECLHRKGVPVVCTTSNAASANGTDWVYVDMTRPKTLQNLPVSVHSIIYLAQSPHYRNFPEQAAPIWEVNVQGVLLLLNYARCVGARHFVLASSGSVYAPAMEDITEASPLDIRPGSSLYTQSKIAAELLLNAYADYFSTVRLRFFMPYGPGLNPTMLMARLVHSISCGELITLRGDTGLIYNPVYVGDAAHCITGALELEGAHTINVAGGQETNLREVATYIAQLLGEKAGFSNSSGTQRMVADISRMCTFFGKPQTSLEQGIETYIFQARGINRLKRNGCCGISNQIHFIKG